MSRDELKVVVTRRLPDEILARIREAASVQLWDSDDPIPYDTLVEWIANCDGLYCLLTERIDAGLLDVGSKLKVISQMAVGYDNIDIAACTTKRIPVGNTPGVLDETTADLALALMLASARRIVEGADFVKAGKWGAWRPMEMVGRDLYGSTVGIIGLGRIGKAVARRLNGFGCKLLYFQRSSDPKDVEFGASYVDLPTLLRESDFVTLHCPLNAETRGLIDKAALRQMKPTAILINTARGPIVDQEALYWALTDGVIAGAGLDVTTPEPLPKDHPLLSLANVVVVPHIGSATIATRMRMATLAVENLLAGIYGERLPFCVNPEVYES